MQIGSDKAQKVKERVLRDYGFWREHIASSKGSDIEAEKKSDLRKLKLFWDVYVEDPDFSVLDDIDNPDSGPSLVERMESILASKTQTSHGDRNLQETDLAYIAEIAETFSRDVREKLGLRSVKDDSFVEQNDAKHTSRPGRPHFSEDVWVWSQIHEHGGDPKEVFSEWFEKPGVKARNLDLDNAKRQFNKIKKKDWYKRD